MKTFDSLAEALDQGPLFEELTWPRGARSAIGSRPFREMGIRTLLPHLGPLVHGVARVVKVRALREMQQGKVDDAVATLRLGYELSDKLGREPILISGLVSLNITTSMNDGWPG